MQNTIASFKLASYSPDILIEIPKDLCTIYEFERAKEMIEVGRIETEKILDSLV
jgi:NTE family protein